jgi:hypothetical protein
VVAGEVDTKAVQMVIPVAGEVVGILSEISLVMVMVEVVVC